MRGHGENSRAFTLIELLIVATIIGILAAIAVPNLMNAQMRAKIAKAESELRTIGTALESYRMAITSTLHGRTPVARIRILSTGALYL